MVRDYNVFDFKRVYWKFNIVKDVREEAGDG
jgi:hypothetical protein